MLLADVLPPSSVGVKTTTVERAEKMLRTLHLMLKQGFLCRERLQ